MNRAPIPEDDLQSEWLELLEEEGIEFAIVKLSINMMTTPEKPITEPKTLTNDSLSSTIIKCVRKSTKNGKVLKSMAVKPAEIYCSLQYTIPYEIETAKIPVYIINESIFQSVGIRNPLARIKGYNRIAAIKKRNPADKNGGAS